MGAGTLTLLEAPGRRKFGLVVPPAVGWDWVEQRRPPVVLADVRWYVDGRPGREAYERGHIPGAIFVDLDRDLSGSPSAGRGRHPLPSPEEFAAAMARLGISDASLVVAYDDQGGVMAARLVWMLRATGREAALLDGGLAAYRGPLEAARDGGVGAGPCKAPRVSFEALPWAKELLAGIDDVLDPANLVIDARSEERYHGKGEKLDPRAGHIPGAVSLPCWGNLEPSGKFLPVGELRRRFEAVGVREGSPVVSYCGSGVTACHNLLALELCGLGRGRLYPGSWSEYSSHPGLPVET
jgi:thiosulfate/3-mercaptopyruvate sulfurtransferase